MSEDSRSKLLRKVQGLLAKAESSPFSEEAQTFREKADQLMTVHAIREFELYQSGAKKRTEPIKRQIIVSDEGGLLKDELVSLFIAVTRHCNTYPVFWGLNLGPKAKVTAQVVGYEEDIDYAETLYVSLRMSLARDMSPQYDEMKTLEQNVYKMKNAGMKWEQIATACGDPGTGKDGKWIRRYKKQCKIEGTEPIGANPTNYVRNYAAGFNTEVDTRLRQMRESTAAAVDTSMALVMVKSKEEDVAAKVHEFFPRLGRSVSQRSTKFNGNARSAGKAAGAKADLSGGRNQAGTAQRGRALGF